MRVFRICRAPYTTLDGEGARINGGRWNSPGRAMVYTSSSLALAALEMLVHVTPDTAPDDLVALTIEVPDLVRIDALDPSILPAGWAQGVDVPACRAAGDAWVESGTAAVLRVPAAPIPEEYNYLIAPSHVQGAQIKIVEKRPFHFDPRLVE